MKSILFTSLSLSLALGTAACTSPSDDSEGSQVDPEIVSAVDGLPRIRTFEDWIATHGYVLNADQQSRYNQGVAVLGVVPQADLPVRHQRSGVIEMSDEMLTRQKNGTLDFHKDFGAWIEAGLYDPTSSEERLLAARHMTGDPKFELEPLVIHAFAGSGSDTTEDETPPGPNCKYIVNVAAGQSSLVNTPPGTTWADTTIACPNHTGQIANQFIGGAPQLGAYANGGSHTSGGGLTFQCTQLSQTSSISQSQVTVGYFVTQEKLDPNLPLNCPAPALQVETRTKAALFADLHLDFVKTWLQWNPIGVVMPDVDWKGRAAGTVEAYVNNSNWKASATGEIQVGSECSVTNTGGFGANVGGGGTSGVSATISSSSTCNTQAWPAADNARNQTLYAQADDVPTTLTASSQTVSAAVKAQGFSAEAWSADPPRGRPSFSRWKMRSNAYAQTRGGCIRIALTGCSLQTPTTGLACQVSGTGQASYSTSSGVDCAPFPVPGLPVAVAIE